MPQINDAMTKEICMTFDISFDPQNKPVEGYKPGMLI